MVYINFFINNYFYINRYNSIIRRWFFVSDNIIIIGMIILWSLICIITGIITILYMALMLLVLIACFIINIIITDSIKKIHSKYKDKKEIKTIHNRRIITLDYKQDTSENTEKYYISKTNPKYVYYHNSVNDAITLLNRDNGNLWLIQPSNTNPKYIEYKLKYPKMENAIDITDEKLKDDNYLKKEGMMLTNNYYLEKQRLPGYFT